MSESDKNYRVDKFDKRRKNTKSLTIFSILGSVLLVVFIALLVVDEDNSENMSGESGTNHSASDYRNNNGGKNGLDSKNNSKGSDDRQSSESDGKKENDDDEMEKNKVKPSDDNVIKAYTSNWQPIGTKQTGSHTINYNEGSQDRIEMRKAVSVATNLNNERLIMWWIESNGKQKVVITASDANETKTYRVYMSWVKTKGWKPTKVEELKKNDQKHKFE